MKKVESRGRKILPKNVEENAGRTFYISFTHHEKKVRKPRFCHPPRRYRLRTLAQRCRHESREIPPGCRFQALSPCLLMLWSRSAAPIDRRLVPDAPSSCLVRPASQISPFGTGQQR